MARPQHAQRLLERFANAGEARPERQTKTDRQRLQESVTRYLAYLLNTRQGSVAIDPLFGIPDFANLPGSFAPPESREVARAIAAAISRYEPRLQDVRVDFLGAGRNSLQMGFNISGTIRHGDEAIDLKLATGLRADGSFSMTP